MPASLPIYQKIFMKQKQKTRLNKPKPKSYFLDDLLTIINTALALALILSIYEAVVVMVGYNSIENSYIGLVYSFNYAFKNNLRLVSILLIFNVVWLAALTPILSKIASLNPKNVVCQLVKGLPLLGLALKYGGNSLIDMGIPGAAFILGSDSNIKLKSLSGIISICVIVIIYITLFKLFSSATEKKGFSVKSSAKSLVPILAITVILCFVIKYVEANRQSNVLLIVVDSLRADHLGCYGYPRGTSPNIDKFAGEGIRFSNAFANATSTIVSSPTIYASVYPSQHKVKSYKDFFDYSFVTMAEALLEEGYNTLGIVTNPHLTEYNGFNQGFQQYYSDIQWNHTGNIAANVNKTFLDWLGYQDRQHKFFALLFYIDPHVPYEAPPPFNTKFEHYVAAAATTTQGKKLTKAQKQLIVDYDEEIYYFDYQFGKLIDELKKTGVYDNTLIILAADHGEEFWEHDRTGHGQSLYKELVNTPLIMKLPAALNNKYLKYKEIEREMLVSNVDILPTTLGLLNIPVAEAARRQFVGKNIFNDSNENASSFVFFEQILTQYGPYVLQGIRTNEWKYIVTYKDGDKPTAKFPMFELYNIKENPAETENLINRRPGMAKKLAAMLNEQQQKMEIKPFTPKRVELNEIIRERLKSLGYIN